VSFQTRCKGGLPLNLFQRPLYRQSMEPSLAVTFPATSHRTQGWQVAARVQYVIAQVAMSFAGYPQDEIAQVLMQRMRGIGVPPNERDVQRFAQSIAALKKTS